MNVRVSKNCYETIFIYYFNKVSKVNSKSARFIDVTEFLKNEIAHE